MSHGKRGLYSKYVVLKNSALPHVVEEALDNGSLDDHVVSPCFVLRYDRDEHARAALQAYAESVRIENEPLARQICREVEEHVDIAHDDNGTLPQLEAALAAERAKSARLREFVRRVARIAWDEVAAYDNYKLLGELASEASDILAADAGSE